MESYNFWQDFFDTYQSLPDWLKALWLNIPPAFALSVLALIIRLKAVSKRVTQKTDGELARPIERRLVQAHLSRLERQLIHNVGSRTRDELYEDYGEDCTLHPRPSRLAPLAPQGEDEG